VRKARDTERFGRLQERVFHREHTESEALAWLQEQGPYSPKLRDWVGRYRDRFDYWISFSYRYWTTFHAMQQATGKSILVPTAEPDPTIDVPIYEPLFRNARGIVFNSHEERDMILARSAAHEVPADVVGVGIEEPEEAAADRFRKQTGITEPFLFYIGRIDANKGCRQLFDFFQRSVDRLEEEGVVPPQLVLAGNSVLPVPEHPRIRYLGTVSEQEKYDALAACSMLIMPSFYESLSMVLLEAWALRKPVLVNGHCDVLRGQTVRSGGGLYYRDGDEFREALRLLMSDERLRECCGRNGRKYFEDGYTWRVIEGKYERLLQQLAAEDGLSEAVIE
jgi:glycosyltransferase involved in cell wall biosynthesis